MNCPNCGTPLPDGAMFCGTCGTPLGQQAQQMQYQPGMQPQGQPGMQPQGQPGVQPQGQPGMQPQGQPDMYGQSQQGMYGQPQQGMYGQPQQGMYGQPQQGMYGQPQQQGMYPPGYMAPKPKMIRVPKYVKPSICRIVGAVLILIASIVPVWFGQSYGGGYAGAGFFVSGGGILGLWGVLLMLTAVALLFFEVDVTAFRNAQGKFHALPFARFYLPGFALFLLLMGTFAHSAGTHDIGWGWWLCLIGILLSCISPVMDIIQAKK